MEEQQTMTLTAKKMPERQISDPGPIAELKFEPSQIPVIAEIENHETLGTDMIMLQKADLWMSQFKKRLNFGIIVMVMLWTGVSYYKSIEMPTDIPEAELLVAHDDAESKDSTLVDLMESDRLLRPVSAEVVATENLTESEAGDAPALDEKVAATAMDKSPVVVTPNKAVTKASTKKAVTQKTSKPKSKVTKAENRNQKKLKKAIAAKAAP